MVGKSDFGRGNGRLVGIERVNQEFEGVRAIRKSRRAKLENLIGEQIAIDVLGRGRLSGSKITLDNGVIIHRHALQAAADGCARTRFQRSGSARPRRESTISSAADLRSNRWRAFPLKLKWASSQWKLRKVRTHVRGLRQRVENAHGRVYRSHSVRAKVFEKTRVESIIKHRDIPAKLLLQIVGCVGEFRREQDPGVGGISNLVHSVIAVIVTFKAFLRAPKADGGCGLKSQHRKPPASRKFSLIAT